MMHTGRNAVRWVKKEQRGGTQELLGLQKSSWKAGSFPALQREERRTFSAHPPHPQLLSSGCAGRQHWLPRHLDAQIWGQLWNAGGTP